MRKNTRRWLAALALACLCVLTPAAAAQAAQRITNTKTYIGALNMAPALIAELKAAGQAEGYAEYEQALRPSSLIVRADKDGNALDAGGGAIGTLGEVYATARQNGILTVVAVEDIPSADALSAWLTESGEFDLSVMSGDASVVKYVRSKHANIRGIVDYSKRDRIDAETIVGETNEAGAHIAVLSRRQADADTVAYLQARFKAVWAVADSPGEFDVYALVSNGVYGIVTDGDTRELYRCYDSYAPTSLARPFLNIGHRGLGTRYPENTLEACVAAYESGADAVEIDMKVSADGEIFILHDSTLDTVTDGTGIAENMTLAELKGYRVTKAGDGSDTGMACDIPTLDDIFGYFRDKDDCVVICEIKTVKTEVVRLFAEKVEEYGMAGKVVVIAFSLPMLDLMQKTPGAAAIPTAYLNGMYQASAAEDLQALARNNTVINAKTDHQYFEERNLKNRGYLLYSWTYSTVSQVMGAVKTGVLGVTNDCADAFADYQKRILPRQGYTVSEGTELEDAVFKADILKYDRSVEERDCKVFRYVLRDGWAEAILQSERDGYIIYSSPVRIDLISGGGEDVTADPSPSPQAEGSAGCGCGASASASLLPVFAAGVFALLRKKG